MKRSARTRPPAHALSVQNPLRIIGFALAIFFAAAAAIVALT